MERIDASANSLSEEQIGDIFAAAFGIDSRPPHRAQGKQYAQLRPTEIAAKQAQFAFPRKERRHCRQRNHNAVRAFGEQC